MGLSFAAQHSPRPLSRTSSAHSGAPEALLMRCANRCTQLANLRMHANHAIPSVQHTGFPASGIGPTSIKELELSGARYM